MYILILNLVYQSITLIFCRHTVVIAHVPVDIPADPANNQPAVPGWAVQHAGTGYHSAELQNIQMFCCGPRGVTIKCQIGARTAVPCAHVLFAVYALGLLSANPGAFRSSHRRRNYFDTGNVTGFNAELWAEHLH